MELHCQPVSHILNVLPASLGAGIIDQCLTETLSVGAILAQLRISRLACVSSTSMTLGAFQQC